MWLCFMSTLLYRFYSKLLPKEKFQVGIKYCEFLIQWKALPEIYSDAHKTLSLLLLAAILSVGSRTPTSLSLAKSTILGKILNTVTEEPMTSWSHKYYVLCFPHCCLMFHIEVGTIKQTTAHKRMGPLIPRGIILVEGVFSTGPARKSY